MPTGGSNRMRSSDVMTIGILTRQRDVVRELNIPLNMFTSEGTIISRTGELPHG